MNPPRCVDCHNFKVILSGRTGECRAHPPTLVPDGGGAARSLWPVVQGIDWCDEFRQYDALRDPAPVVLPYGPDRTAI